MYEIHSVNKFTETFNRKDYLCRSECREKLEKWGFYSIRIKGIYFNKLNFYISVESLIRGNEIPNEYRLVVTQFDNLKLISKKSFAKTLKFLHNESKRLNPKPPKGFVLKKTKKGGKRVNPFSKKPLIIKKKSRTE